MPKFLRLNQAGFFSILPLLVVGLLVTLSLISIRFATQDESSKVEGVSYSLVRHHQPTAIPEASQDAQPTDQQNH